MTLILKYLSWLLTVGVGFAGSWLFEFVAPSDRRRLWHQSPAPDRTGNQEDGPDLAENAQRKRLTRSGKWGVGLAIVGLVSALTWTVLDDIARYEEKAKLVEFQEAIQQGQLTITQK